MSNILLSICIPTYNRSYLLDKTISSIINQKEFDHQIELVISDNCSNDNTFQIVQKYQETCSNIKYNRNGENIGMEKNIFKVLSLGEGKFLKLLNDYSVIVEGGLMLLIDAIQKFESDHNIIFFSNKNFNTKAEFTYCQNINEFIDRSSYWTTWILCFGIWKTEFNILIKGQFKEYNFPHLDLLLRNLESGFKPVIANIHFCDNQLTETKGGYNLFETFIQNYLTLLKDHIGFNKITNETYKSEKRKLLFNFILPWYCALVIQKDKDFNFGKKGACSYILKHYGIKDILFFLYKVVKFRISYK